MGRRWAWVGMVGLCALTAGCHERGEREAAVTQEQAAPAPGAQQAAVGQPSGPQAGGTVTGGAGPAAAGVASTAAGAGTTAGTAMNPGTGTVAGAPAGTGGTAAGGTGTPGRTGGTAGGAAAGMGSTEEAPEREARVMIGYEAVQARDDEAWHLGAARAAQEAAPRGATDGSLEEVVIASSSVSGRVTRVRGNTLTVRDSEGGVYELELDRRSRGLRQGRRVPLKELQEGTPVRANFVLMGGRTVARDVQIRR